MLAARPMWSYIYIHPTLLKYSYTTLLIARTNNNKSFQLGDVPELNKLPKMLLYIFFSWGWGVCHHNAASKILGYPHSARPLVENLILSIVHEPFLVCTVGPQLKSVFFLYVQK